MSGAARIPSVECMETFTPAPSSENLGQPPSPGGADPVPATTSGGLLAPASLVLAVAGLLPLLPGVGSLAAVVCGVLALRARPATSRGIAIAGLVLGVLELLAPLVFLFVYCVVLGYPMPIHRYHPGGAR